MKNRFWKNQFSERELKEIRFCELYCEEFGHGTDGHLIRSIVGKFVSYLDCENLDFENTESSICGSPSKY
jgi:hypothetical protein